MKTIGNIPKTGIGMIDNEHIRLANITNMLLHSIEQHNFSSSSITVIIEKLDEMLFHMETHCRNEEELMHGVGYPDFDMHKSTHDDILIKFRRTYDDFVNHHDYKDLSNFIRTVLFPWLHTHTSEDDMVMAEYLHSKANSD
jgi:hemerythrin